VETVFGPGGATWDEALTLFLEVFLSVLSPEDRPVLGEALVRANGVADRSEDVRQLSAPSGRPYHPGRTGRVGPIILQGVAGGGVAP
jgi:hypothetical protein